jgi:hypothetical protein
VSSGIILPEVSFSNWLPRIYISLTRIQFYKTDMVS